MRIARKMLQAIAVALALLVPIASSVGQHNSAHPQPISSMTPEELAWLDQHEPVRMVYDPDWAPFEWQSADGVHTGIIADLVDIIRSKSGLNIEVINTPLWSESVDQVRAGKADIFSAITINDERKGYLNFTTNNIYSYPAVLLTRFSDTEVYLDAVTDLNGKRIGIVKGSGLGAYVRDSYPQLEYIEVASTRAGFDGVREGTIDLFTINSVTARYFIEKRGYSDIKVALRWSNGLVHPS